MTMNRKKIGSLAALAIIVLLSLLMNVRYLNDYPAYVHAWAMADRYALAVGYVDNGLDLLHPQTSVYNKQFPDDWSKASDSPITAVDCPLHEYVIAVFMTLLGSTAPWIFRLWTLIVAMVGMFFLFLISRLLTDDWFKSMLVVLVTMTAPAFAYYYAAFIPTVPSLSCCIAGLYCYLLYYKGRPMRFFVCAMMLMTVGVLMRTSFAVMMVAVLAFEFLRMCRRETAVGYKWLVVLVCLAVYGAYWYWNGLLRQRYGSLFLSYLLPPRQMSDFSDIYAYMKGNWKYHYFQRIHYWIVAFSFMLMTIYLCVRRRPVAAASKDAAAHLSLWWLVAIWLFGVLLFFVAMLRQYHDHDYYFLDSFFLPILFAFVLALAVLPSVRSRVGGVVSLSLLIALTVYCMHGVSSNHATRCPADDRAYQVVQRFMGGDRLMDDAGIAPDAKVLVLYSYPQQTPLLLLHRHGYIVMDITPSRAPAALTFGADAIVIEKEMVRQRYDEYSDVLQRITPFSANEHLVVCRLSDTVTHHSADEFFACLSDENPCAVQVGVE